MAEISYRRHRFPPVIIQHAVWLYLHFTLSYRDVEELLAERGLDISYETVRYWVLKFGPVIARRLRRRRPRPSNRWLPAGKREWNRKLERSLVLRSGKRARPLQPTMGVREVPAPGCVEMKRMKRQATVAGVIGAGLIYAMAASADPYNPGERALGGGLLGAGTGAVIGAIAGGGRGAGIGAAVGGGLGAVAGAATTPAPPRASYRRNYHHVQHRYYRNY